MHLVMRTPSRISPLPGELVLDSSFASGLDRGALAMRSFTLPAKDVFLLTFVGELEALNDVFSFLIDPGVSPSCPVAVFLFSIS